MKSVLIFFFFFFSLKIYKSFWMNEARFARTVIKRDILSDSQTTVSSKK